MVLHLQMHTIEDSTVKMIDQIGRQDQNAIEVFQLSEEDCHQSVAFQS